MPDLADRPMFGMGEAVEGSRRSPRIGIAVAVVVIAAFVAGIWYVYDRGVRRGDLKALPVITAEGGPVKSTPADAGGLKVPHVDGEMPRASASRGSKVEDILPPPERPLAERKVVERTAPPEPAMPLAADPPKAEVPKVETPKVETPKAEAPKAETPKAETLKAETLKAETPKVEAPAAAPPPVSAVDVAPRSTPSPPSAAVARAAPTEPAEKSASQTPASQPAPAAAPSEKAPPTVATVAPAAGRDGGYRIQLASVGEKGAAEGEWRRLSKANGDVLGKLSHSVVSVDLPGKGIFHRLSAGPFPDRNAATEACETLHKRKVRCFVVAP